MTSVTDAESRTDGPGGVGPRSFQARPPAPAVTWRTAAGVLTLETPALMGVINLTPDSFSDGGRYASIDQAVEEASSMVAAGAVLVDVGGESTRPGAEEVPAAEELARVLPFVRRAAGRLGVPISVDTRKASVAKACLAAGAAVINDVSGLSHDPELGEVVAGAGAGLVLMHTRGTPAGMAARARYADVAEEVAGELAAALQRAHRAGVAEEAVVLDPGIGFAKTAEQSLAMVTELEPLLALGRPVLLGPSRKSFIGALTGAPTGERVAGTVAACLLGYLSGAAIFRVHDVAPVAQALALACASIRRGRSPGGAGAP